MKMKTILATLTLSVASLASLNAQTTEKSAKAIAFTAAYREPDSNKVIILGEQFLKDYPFKKTNAEADKAEDINYWKIYLNLITKTKGPMEDKIKQYYDVLPYYAVSELYYRQVFLLNLHKLKTPQELYGRSVLLMNKFATFKNNRPAEFADKTEEEWMKSFDFNYYANLLTQVELMRKTGRVKEGLALAQELSGHYGYKITSFNEDYALLLDAAGMKTKSVAVLEAAVNNNQASPLMLDMLKKEYLTKNKDDKGFDAYVESLKSKEGKAALEEEIAKSIVKKSLPHFTMYDGNGKLVDTKDWKGKVVVLDFFASWCVPCKAAFPGMKMAIEKLAADKDVVFYFIDVNEHIKDYKTPVMKYMKDNDLPFNVLFDNVGEKGINNQVANQIGISTIPRKMILDKNGFVRFDTDSYYGSPTKLADEIKIMVNLTKKAI